MGNPYHAHIVVEAGIPENSSKAYFLALHLSAIYSQMGAYEAPGSAPQDDVDQGLGKRIRSVVERAFETVRRLLQG